MVTDILVADSALSEAELLTLAASAEQGSEHPLGEAIVGAAKERQLPLVEAKRFFSDSRSRHPCDNQRTSPTFGQYKINERRSH